jgi:serine/threonine protein kinase
MMEARKISSVPRFGIKPDLPPREKASVSRTKQRLKAAIYVGNSETPITKDSDIASFFAEVSRKLPGKKSPTRTIQLLKKQTKLKSNRVLDNDSQHHVLPKAPEPMHVHTPEPKPVPNVKSNGLGLCIDINASMESIGSVLSMQQAHAEANGYSNRRSVNKKQIIERENSNNSFADADASVDAHANNNSFSSTNSNSHNQNIIRPSNDSMNTPKRITNKNKINKEIDLLLEKASPNAYPIKRLDNIGHGSSSYVYRSIMLDTLEICAEKVLVVGHKGKRLQVLRELEVLRNAVKRETQKYQLRRSQSMNLKSSISISPMKGQSDSYHCNSSSTSVVSITGTNTDVNVNTADISSQQEKDDSDCGRSRPDGSQHIVQLLGIVPSPYDGTLSICLEYMNGGSLQDLINIGGCDNVNIIKGISVQLVAGMEFLHSMRVIHRDIKPSNCLLSSNGVVKLADFGIAKQMENGVSIAESFIGTFEYMSPERVAGGKYTFLSDVWSIGLTIHAVAIGRYPYYHHGIGGIEKNNYWALLNCIQEQPTLLPPSDTFDDEFIDFISIACEKNPKKRQNAKSLLNHRFLDNAVVPTTSSVDTNTDDADADVEDEEDNDNYSEIDDTNTNSNANTNTNSNANTNATSNGATRRMKEEEELATHLMSAAEAGSIADAWGKYASQSFANSIDINEKINDNSSSRTTDEINHQRKLAMNRNNNENEIKKTHALLYLTSNSVSHGKISKLALAIGCSNILLRTAFHAAIGDLRLSAMYAIAQGGKISLNDINTHTIAVKSNKKALALKLLAHEYIEEEEYISSASDDEEETKKKEDKKIDTDEENLMFSDNDCPDLTSSENDDSDDSDDSDRELNPEEMMALGAEIFLEMKAKGIDPASVDRDIGGGFTLPKIRIT